MIQLDYTSVYTERKLGPLIREIPTQMFVVVLFTITDCGLMSIHKQIQWSFTQS